MIIGIDEVGRGPWAGPLVVCAVGFKGEHPEGLTDSKKLTKKRREALVDKIKESTTDIGISSVSAADIDRVGLSEALRRACAHAVSQIDVLPSDQIVIDGTVNFLAGTLYEQQVSTMKKADLLVSSVSAASIVAKVARDNYMASQDAVYPGYNFASHVGYGTAAHSAAIEKLGVTPLHRLSFAPLAKYKEVVNLNAPEPHVTTTTKQIGDEAESVVTDYLRRDGHDILERNWKTKMCEIDIVSRKNDTIYFTEVKHRKNADQGGGLAAITPKKLRQMTFATKVYAKFHSLDAINIRLVVATTIGDIPELEQFLVLD